MGVLGIALESDGRLPPIMFAQSASRASPIFMMALLAIILSALLVPFVLVVEHLAIDPSTRLVVAERPLVAAQLCLAFLSLTVIFGWPLARLARVVGSAREVHIVDGHVNVTDRTLLGSHTWMEPIASYVGLAHHVRASLSGVRHELIMVHAEPGRSVLMAVAPRMADADVTRVAKLLNLAEIPSRPTTSLSPFWGEMGPIEPRLGLEGARA